MFVVTLKFAHNKAQAAQFMEGHKAWIRRGLEDGVFLLAGSLQAGAGGAILAYNAALAELQARVNEDPFVAEGVVSAEIAEITPLAVDPRLAFLSGQAAQ